MVVRRGPASLRKLQQSLTRELEYLEPHSRIIPRTGSPDVTLRHISRLSLAGSLVKNLRGSPKDDDSARHPAARSRPQELIKTRDGVEGADGAGWVDDLSSEGGRAAIFEALELQNQVIQNLQHDIVRLKAEVPDDVSVQMTSHGAVSLLGPISMPQVSENEFRCNCYGISLQRGEEEVSDREMQHREQHGGTCWVITLSSSLTFCAPACARPCHAEPPCF